MLYDTEIDILYASEGYTDDFGIWHDGEEEVIVTIYGDLQPYSSDLVYKDYGYRVECTNRIFCDKNIYISEGTKFRIAGAKYKVTKVIDWGSYVEVVVKGE